MNNPEPWSITGESIKPDFKVRQFTSKQDPSFSLSVQQYDWRIEKDHKNIAKTVSDGFDKDLKEELGMVFIHKRFYDSYKMSIQNYRFRCYKQRVEYDLSGPVVHLRRYCVSFIADGTVVLASLYRHGNAMNEEQLFNKFVSGTTIR